MTGGLAVADATVRIGPAEVLAGVSVEVPSGGVVGLVGPNGAGKTTLLDAVTGLVPLAGGHIRLEGTDVTGLPPHRRARLGVGRTFQARELFDDLTVEENLQVATEGTGRPARGSSPPPTWVPAPTTRLAGTLAHHDRAQAALARALAGEPQFLLLDEPAAGLDAAARRALADDLRRLAGRGVGILLAEHDVDFVLGLCDTVYVLDLGRVIASGRPGAVRHDPAVTAAYLGEAARTASTPRRRASQGEPGEALLEARGVVAGYGAAPVLHGVDLQVRAGEVVALLGPNGAGKTTTVRAVSGVLPLFAGTVEGLGGPVDRRPHRLARRGMAVVPQDGAVLRLLTVGENLRLASHGARTERAAAVDAALDRFPALVPLLPRRAGTLSGGEQHLLALARAVAARPRLLLVDEVSLGLAPRAARAALEAVRAAADAGGGVLVVEQHPDLALEVADRAVVLARGQVVFEGPTAELATRPEVLAEAYLGRAVGG